MAAETKVPDAILAATEQSGAFTVIDEDPDSSGTDFLTSSGNNVNTDCRVSFPTPTGNPTVGTGLQEFRIQVREHDTGQTGTPDGRIELWENGSLVRAGSDVPITTQDQVIAFTWNANELGTADGSLVECKFVGTKSGGSPGARNTTELGAVEWNVEYTSASPVNISAAVQVITPILPSHTQGVGVDLSAGVQNVASSLPASTVGTGVGIAAAAKIVVPSVPSYTQGLGIDIGAAAQQVSSSLPVYSVSLGLGTEINAAVQIVTMVLPSYTQDTGVNIAALQQVVGTALGGYTQGLGRDPTPGAQLVASSIPSYQAGIGITQQPGAQIAAIGIPTYTVTTGVADEDLTTSISGFGMRWGF